MTGEQKNRFIFSVEFAAFLFSAALLLALICGDSKAEGQFIMVDEEGQISPPGYTLGLDQIAAAAADTAAASNRVRAVAEATAESEAVVSNLTEVLVGTTSFGYINGFIVSFGGVAAVSTNAACSIVKFEAGAEHEVIDGVECDGHYIWYVFSEPMNSVPYIKWKSALTDGEWNIVPTQDIIHYPDGTVLGGVSYNNLYRSTAFTEASLTKAFYLAYCDIAAPDGDGSVLPIHGGITVNGQTGFTGETVVDGFRFTFRGGLLMSAPVPAGGDE